MQKRREKQVEILQIGEFEISSGKMVVSDPCYNRQTWCAKFDVPAKNGVWNASVKMMNEGCWGYKIGSLIAKHQEWPTSYFPITEKWDLGVDSGQLGFFDNFSYATDVQREIDECKSIEDISHFYGKCCMATLQHPIAAEIIDGSGVVSSSGGDGSYTAHTQYNNTGELVAIEVVFIKDEEEDEEDDKEDNEEDEKY